MFVGKNEGVLASATSANGSIEMNFVVADDLGLCHSIKLGVSETSGALRHFNGRWVGVSRAGMGSRSKRMWFVTCSHDFPRKG